LIGTGGYADVFEGALKVDKKRKREKVAVKRLRLVLSKEKEFAQVCRACAVIRVRIYNTG
jgi:hypothetical protein